METLTHPPVPCGPLLEETRLSGGLDYYKPTMSQLQFEKHADAEVTFTFKNRGDHRLVDYVTVEKLQSRLDQLQANGWTQEEIDYFRSLQTVDGQPMFSDEYLAYLEDNGLPPVEVRIDEETDDLAIETSGKWPLVTFWETVVMSDVNELYFEEFIRSNGLDIFEVYDEGDRRLSDKIALLQSNPDIKFADFGTRRHFSLRWQKHVVERLKSECPENFAGTSNVALAHGLEVKPIGTFAHEVPMVYAGIADATGEDIRTSQGRFLDDWYERYGDGLAIALTDTFGTDAFFNDFNPDQAVKYRGTRQDSGDPIEYGEKVIEFYENLGINPTSKTIVFSDGLDIQTIIDIHDHFKGRINAMFGWGTTLTNDLGIKALNIVMKATHVKLPETGQEADLVKLSDDQGKHTGPADLVKQYQDVHFATKEAAKEGAT